jgi:hypothetical protein
LRAQVAKDESWAAKAADDAEGHAADPPDTPSPHADESPVPPYRQRTQAPWAIRNSRWLSIGALLLAAMALAYAYPYLRNTFGPSPLDRITADAIKRDAVLSPAEKAPSGAAAEVIPSVPMVDRFEEPPARSIPTVVEVPAASSDAAKQPAAIANGEAGAPSAESLTPAPTRGAAQLPVTHTHPAVAAQMAAGPAAAQERPKARAVLTVSSGAKGQALAGAGENARRNQPRAGRCAEAVAALGLCTPQVEGK